VGAQMYLSSSIIVIFNVGLRV